MPLTGERLEQVLHEYERWMTSWGASDSTIRARRSFARGRLRDWGLDGFTEDNIADLFADIVTRQREKNRKRTRWTLPTYYSNLRELCAWLAAAGYIDSDPMPNVRKPGRPKSHPKPLTDREVGRVMAAARPDVRDWMTLALYLGLRVSEIARIRGEDLRDGLLCVEGKGGGIDSLPCRAEILEMAARYPEQGWWFPGTDPAGHVRSQVISRDVAAVFRQCGINEGSCHRLRHTYATRLLRAGVNIRRVQKLMRHASLETTAGYTAVDEDADQEAVNLLPPLPPAA